jgi:peptidylprolyl isomerase
MRGPFRGTRVLFQAQKPRTAKNVQLVPAYHQAAPKKEMGAPEAVIAATASLGLGLVVYGSWDNRHNYPLVGGFFEQPVVTTITDRAFFDLAVQGRPAGRVTVGLYGEAQPLAVANFKALCAGPDSEEAAAAVAAHGGVADASSHYAGTSVHRIIPGFIVQMGDTEHSADGSGGAAVIGGEHGFPDQNLRVPHGGEGTLAMVNFGADCNRSQFYVTLGATPDLDGSSLVFGRVTEGFGVIRRVGKLGVGEGEDMGKPTRRVTIENCGVLRAGEEIAAAVAAPAAVAAAGGLGAEDEEALGAGGAGAAGMLDPEAAEAAEWMSGGGGGGGGGGAAPAFAAAPAWEGARPGCFFGTGEQGTGYYCDDKLQQQKKRLVLARRDVGDLPPLASVYGSSAAPSTDCWAEHFASGFRTAYIPGTPRSFAECEARYGVGWELAARPRTHPTGAWRPYSVPAFGAVVHTNEVGADAAAPRLPLLRWELRVQADAYRQYLQQRMDVLQWELDHGTNLKRDFEDLVAEMDALKTALCA